MLVFVDESGDAGLKIDIGSSAHFIVARVIFDDYEEAQKADNHVTTIPRQLNVRTDFEFHFHKLRSDRSLRCLAEMIQSIFLKPRPEALIPQPEAALPERNNCRKKDNLRPIRPLLGSYYAELPFRQAALDRPSTAAAKPDNLRF